MTAIAILSTALAGMVICQIFLFGNTIYLYLSGKLGEGITVLCCFLLLMSIVSSIFSLISLQL